MIRGIARILRSTRIARIARIGRVGRTDRIRWRHLFLFFYRIGQGCLQRCGFYHRTDHSLELLSVHRHFLRRTILLHLLQPLNLCGCGNRSVFGRLLIGNQSEFLAVPNRRLRIFVILLQCHSRWNLKRIFAVIAVRFGEFYPAGLPLSGGFVFPECRISLKGNVGRLRFRLQHFVGLRVLVQHISQCICGGIR